MSLRLRAVLIAALAFAALWALAAGWMLRGMQERLDHTLDQRLVMSARMVSGLLERSTLVTSDAAALASAVTVGGGQGIACQIRTLRGEIVASTSGVPGMAMEAPVPGFADRRIGDATWRTYTLRFGDYHITTADAAGERDQLVRDILLAAGVPFLVALLGGVLALWIGVARGLAPLESLSRTLAARDLESTEPVHDARAPAELRPLLAAFNGVLGRLTESLRQQRAFTDAAAHELRSPLTAVDTHLQVAAMSQGQDAQEAVQHAGEGVRRLRRTLDQLMSLARAEAPGAAEAARSSVREAVADIITRLAPEERHRVTVLPPDGDAVVAMPAGMLATTLRNLLENALRYSGADAPVEVRLAPAAPGGRVLVEVADRGPGMAAEDRNRAGQRFWRGDLGRDGQEGSGLGLSIVRAILSRHGGRLALRDREGGGLVAVVDLPPGPLSL